MKRSSSGSTLCSADASRACRVRQLGTRAPAPGRVSAPQERRRPHRLPPRPAGRRPPQWGPGSWPARRGIDYRTQLAQETRHIVALHLRPRRRTCWPLGTAGRWVAHALLRSLCMPRLPRTAPAARPRRARPALASMRMHATESAVRPLTHQRSLHHFAPVYFTLCCQTLTLPVRAARAGRVPGCQSRQSCPCCSRRRCAPPPGGTAARTGSPAPAQPRRPVSQAGMTG